MKDILKGVDLTKLVEFLKEDGGDGWTIWNTSKFTDMGFDEKNLPVSTIKSDTSSPKSTIFKDGLIVKSVTGVYGLSLLKRLAAELGHGDAGGQLFGRGSQARAITRAILPEVERRIK